MNRLPIVSLILILVLNASCTNIRERGLFGKKARKLEQLLAQQDSIRQADSLKRVENRLKAQEEAYIDSLLKAEEEKTYYETGNNFNIVIGSFLTPAYAEEFAGDYRERGFNPRIIRMDGSSFDLVVIESYDRFSKTTERVGYFRDTLGITVWIYQRK